MKYTAQEIRDALDAGKNVTCHDGACQVIKDSIGQYLIKQVDSDHFVFLTGLAGTEYAETLNATNFVIEE